MSGLITAPEFNKAIPETYENPTNQGFVTAIYEVGCLAGAIFTLIFGDRLGRRRTIMLGAAVMICGAVIQATPFPTAHSFVCFP